jgi:hypothetical protein
MPAVADSEFIWNSLDAKDRSHFKIKDALADTHA